MDLEWVNSFSLRMLVYIGIDAVLEQEERVIAYTSHTLSKFEKNNSVIKKEYVLYCNCVLYALVA